MLRGLAKRGYRAVMGPAVTEDPVRAFRGIAREDLPLLRVMHVGDCSIRAMETTHDFKAPIGYPKVMAERLLDQGIGTEFAHYFAITYEQFPDIERLVKVTKMGGAPDVVLIHTGATYQRRVILNSTPRVNQLRVEVGRRFGRHIRLPHRLFLKPFVRLFGRHWNDYNGPEELERFAREVERTWPNATVVLVPPFPFSWTWPTSWRILDRIMDDYRATAHNLELPLLHFTTLGDDDSLRCANGYNLTSRGSEIVGEELARWIVAELAKPKAEPAAKPAVAPAVVARRAA
jgi:hypothetical protein